MSGLSVEDSKLAQRTVPLLGKAHLWCIGFWFVALAVLVLWSCQSGVYLWRLKHTWITASPIDDAKLYTEQLRNFIGALLLLTGSFVGAITLGNSLKRTALQDAERETNRDSLNSNIFAKAIDQLGSDKIATRLGAIYSLESLAIEETERLADGSLVEQISETLAAFVREQSREIRSLRKKSIDDIEDVREDIEAAVSVLARSIPVQKRPKIFDSDGVNLRGAYLRGISLPEKSDLSNFNFSDADLQNSKLRSTIVSSCLLDRADLSNSDFKFANLSESFFRETNFTKARFDNADLAGSNFEGANFTNANFLGADVSNCISPPKDLQIEEH